MFRTRHAEVEKTSVVIALPSYMLDSRRVLTIRGRVKDLRDVLSRGIWIPVTEPSLNPGIRGHALIRNHRLLDRHFLIREVLQNVLLSVVCCLSLIIR